VCIAGVQRQLLSETRLSISAEAEQKMPKVLKTAASEQDKVESSQTKIKAAQSGCSSTSKGAGL
jgi:hypothetical protein